MHLLLTRARESAIQIVQTVEGSYTKLSAQHEIRSRARPSLREVVLSVRAVSTFRYLIRFDGDSTGSPKVDEAVARAFVRPRGNEIMNGKEHKDLDLDRVNSLSRAAEASGFLFGSRPRACTVSQ